MRDYIKEAAELLKSGKPVVVYGASGEGAVTVSRLIKQLGVAPTCVCDSDPKKWHTRFLGIDVLPLDEVPTDTYIYISSREYLFQIIGQLTEERGVSSERILNYEPVTRRKSCIFLECKFKTMFNEFYFCNSDWGKRKSPFVAFDGDCESTLRKWVALRDQLIGNIADGVPTSCDGCSWLRDDWFPTERRIRMINWSTGGICNFNCSYCWARTLYRDRDGLKMKQEIYAKPLHEAAERFGLLASAVTTEYGAGELALNPERGDFMKILKSGWGYCSANTASNCSVYYEELAEACRDGKAYIITSVDSGTRETFKKIKGVDSFGKVRDNIKRYNDFAGYSTVQMKYIFLPGVNDNKADIEGFIELCQYTGTTTLVLAHDNALPRDPIGGGNVVESASYMLELAAKNGIMPIIFSDKIRAALAQIKKEN
ncbi:hypothetical protein FACS1894216_11320 [Synergistales bacterium]|nr:hypothetical protein FACS1894216_11320 [Synergistales bacterium]